MNVKNGPNSKSDRRAIKNVDIFIPFTSNIRYSAIKKNVKQTFYFKCWVSFRTLKKGCNKDICSNKDRDK